MKREADGDMGSPQKRSRSGDDITVRLLIPSKAAGSIIGKGGHNITKLRTEYKASVTVPDCPGPERILTISSDLDTVLQVVNEIIPNVDDATGRSGSRGGGGGEDVDLRLLVHQSQAGCIIGKSGFKIKELREKTGARIKIFSNCCPQSTERICQISGRPNTCIDSIREIMELIKTSPIKGMNNPYDPHNYDDFHSQEYGGFGDQDGKGGRGGPGGGMYGGMGGPPPMGRGGRFGPGVGGNMGPGPRGPRGGMGGPGGMGPVRGGGFGGGRGGFGGNRGNASNGMMSNSPMNMGGGNSGGQGPMLGGGKGSTQVTIPKDLAGAIIGKGGARIRKIRSDSGAGITIDEPLPGSNDRIITITGSPNQIQMAQYLLQQSCQSGADSGNY